MAQDSMYQFCNSATPGTLDALAAVPCFVLVLSEQTAHIAQGEERFFLLIYTLRRKVK